MVENLNDVKMEFEEEPENEELEVLVEGVDDIPEDKEEPEVKEVKEKVVEEPPKKDIGEKIAEALARFQQPAVVETKPVENVEPFNVEDFNAKFLDDPAKALQE